MSTCVNKALERVEIFRFSQVYVRETRCLSDLVISLTQRYNYNPRRRLRRAAIKSGARKKTGKKQSQAPARELFNIIMCGHVSNERPIFLHNSAICRGLTSALCVCGTFLFAAKYNASFLR